MSGPVAMLWLILPMWILIAPLVGALASNFDRRPILAAAASFLVLVALGFVLAVLLGAEPRGSIGPAIGLAAFGMLTWEAGWRLGRFIRVRNEARRADPLAGRPRRLG